MRRDMARARKPLAGAFLTVAVLGCLMATAIPSQAATQASAELTSKDTPTPVVVATGLHNPRAVTNRGLVIFSRPAKGRYAHPCLRTVGGTLVFFAYGGQSKPFEPEELLLRIEIPALAAGERLVYRKVGTRRAQSISKTLIAIRAKVAGGALHGVRVAAGCVAPIPLRCRNAVELSQIHRSRHERGPLPPP